MCVRFRLTRAPRVFHALASLKRLSHVKHGATQCIRRGLMIAAHLAALMPRASSCVPRDGRTESTLVLQGVYGLAAPPATPRRGAEGEHGGDHRSDDDTSENADAKSLGRFGRLAVGKEFTPALAIHRVAAAHRCVAIVVAVE